MDSGKAVPSAQLTERVVFQLPPNMSEDSSFCSHCVGRLRSLSRNLGAKQHGRVVAAPASAALSC